ncbi:MAG: hypothetical protein HKL80_01925 [Acidimicrobiales bacterium]|nr:hypothetical protein [Acidimicrobiales bacterium]
MPYSGPKVPYDLIKEATIAFLVVAILTTLLAIIFSSPDESAVTIKQWANSDPVDFVTTALSELDGSSLSSQYGPPYNSGTNSQQHVGPFAPQKWAGQRIPVNSAQDFVLSPLSQEASSIPLLSQSLTKWNSASSADQGNWTANYSDALAKATVDGSKLLVPSGKYGPVGEMMSELLLMANSGALDASLTGTSHFYGTDYTKPLLFLADGTYLSGLAQNKHLLGTQWGMMNETGNWPGQAWLWLYTFWYQIPPYNTSTNADALVMTTMLIVSAGLLLVPVIPGLRRIPEYIPVHRIIWRDWYKRNRSK